MVVDEVDTLLASAAPRPLILCFFFFLDFFSLLLIHTDSSSAAPLATPAAEPARASGVRASGDGPRLLSPPLDGEESSVIHGEGG